MHLSLSFWAVSSEVVREGDGYQGHLGVRLVGRSDHLKILPSAVKCLGLVYVVPAIKKMYHADQFTIALCVRIHQPPIEKCSIEYISVLGHRNAFGTFQGCSTP